MKPLVIDAHQHVWNLRRARYDWLGPELPELNRTIEFDELRPQLRAAEVTATVLVQSADNAQDTDYMFEVAAAHPVVVGVVGWLPLDRASEAAARLAELQRDPVFVGVRSLIHDRADPDWLLRPEVGEGLSLLEVADVPFDLVAVLPRHLELVPILCARHPRLRIVIDHLGAPPLGELDRQPWWTLIARAAENPRVFGKVSGLYPAPGASRAERIAQLRPAVHHALDVFGADRLMVGGDWPISTRAGGYGAVHDDLTGALAGLDAREHRRLWGESAREFYRLSEARLTAARTATTE
jgi:L-fuconolactonase